MLDSLFILLVIIRAGSYIIYHTKDVRNELLIVLYLDIHVGHDKKQYIPIKVYSRSTQRCINVHVRLNVRHKICYINTCSH